MCTPIARVKVGQFFGRPEGVALTGAGVGARCFFVGYMRESAAWNLFARRLCVIYYGAPDHPAPSPVR